MFSEYKTHHGVPATFLFLFTTSTRAINILLREHSNSRKTPVPHYGVLVSWCTAVEIPVNKRHWIVSKSSHDPDDNDSRCDVPINTWTFALVFTPWRLPLKASVFSTRSLVPIYTIGIIARGIIYQDISDHLKIYTMGERYSKTLSRENWKQRNEREKERLKDQPSFDFTTSIPIFLPCPFALLTLWLNLTFHASSLAPVPLAGSNGKSVTQMYGLQ